MDQKIKDMFDKAKITTTYVAGVANKKGKEVYESSKSSLKIVELNSQIDALYKEVGKLVYESKKGIEIEDDVLTNKMELISQKEDEIEELKEKKDRIKNTIVCENCQTIGRKDEIYCINCGIKL